MDPLSGTMQRFRALAHGGAAVERDLFLASLLRDHDAETVALIAAAMDDPDWRIQAFAAYALGSLGGSVAVAALRRCAQHRELERRKTSVEALGRLGVAAVPAFLDLLMHPEWDIRARAVEATANVDDPRLISPLCRLLSDPHPLVRVRAARRLGRSRAPEAFAPLVRALEGDDQAVQAAAAESLGNLEDPAAIEPLTDVLRAGPPNVVRQAVVYALMTLGHQPEETGLAVMHALLIGEYRLFSRRGRSLLQELKGWLSAGDARLRYSAARALLVVIRDDPGPELQSLVPFLRAAAKSRRGSEAEKALLQQALAEIRAIHQRSADLPRPSHAREPNAHLLPTPVPQQDDPDVGVLTPRAAGLKRWLARWVR